MRTSFHPMLVTAFMTAAALCASAQSTMNVNISGLCSFPALSWSMQENQTQTGQITKTTVTVSATKTVDACSPRIFEAVVTGQPFSSVTFTAPGAASPMLTLTTVLIAQTQLSDTAPAGVSTESVAFLFENFTTQDSGLSSASPRGAMGTNLTIRDLNCSAGVTAWNIGTASGRTLAVTGGTTSAQPKLSTLQITKPLDACSQQIVQEITNGKILTQVVLTQTTPGYILTITLTGSPNARCEFTSYQVAGTTSAGQPQETIQISYMEINYKIQSVSSTGTLSGTVTASWNQATQTP